MRARVLALVIVLATAAVVEAQQPPAQPPAPAPTPATPAPEISLTATVTARELIFHSEPSVTVEFFGQPERANVWETDRTNLPSPVRPHETYRDIGVRLRIETRFADIEKFLQELLGPQPQAAVLDSAPHPAARFTLAPSPLIASLR